MTTFEKGNIILVPFPFSNQSKTKKRPAIIISSNLYNQSSADLVIMAITSKIEKTHLVGEFKIKNWKAAGLLKSSLAKSAISTIEQSLVLRKLGQLAQQDLQSLDSALKDLLSLK